MALSDFPYGSSPKHRNPSSSIPMGTGSPTFRFAKKSMQGRAWGVGLGLIYFSGRNIQGLVAFIENAEGNQEAQPEKVESRGGGYTHG